MDISEKNSGALNSLKEDLEKEEAAKKKTHILKKIPKNPAKEYPLLEGNVFKRNSEGQLEKLSRNSEGLLEKKIKGASDEMFRQITRDASIEDNLSEGLKDKKDFVKKFKMIDNRRIWVYERSKNNINNIKDDVIFNTKYVLDEEGIKAMKELEKELTDPFAKIVYEKMADLNKQILLDHLVDNQISPDKSETVILDYISGANFYTVCFSDNGYLMQLADKNNKEDKENTLYNIISPDGKIVNQDLNYRSAYDKLEEQSASYQAKLKEEFLNNSLSTDLKLNDQIARKEPLVVMTDKEYINAYNQAHGLRVGLINGRTHADNGDPVIKSLNEAGNNAFLKIVDYVKNTDFKKEELIFTEQFSILTPEQKEIILNIYKEKELTTEPIKDILNEPTISSLDNPSIIFDKQIVEYANEMGVKLEDLDKNPEFISLNVASQKFILEVLNRSSLAKIKVEAAHNFKNEKDQKKWYQLGFAFNQNFHKKKHEILIAKEIHEKGLEGYGETEFSWLTNVVKSGPEINVDEEGAVVVSYLRPEEGDDKERQDLIANYNRDAYDVAGISPDDKEYDSWVRFLNESRENLLKSSKNIEDGIQLVSKLVEAEKQLKLHQFLKGEYKTEKIIRDMVNNSLNGWDETKMLIGGQKDKVAYAGIGMVARTLLRSDDVIGLIGKGFTYAVGPAVAFAIGGYRANVRAAKSLDENAALAKLGVKDDSAMAENLNLAVGKVESDGKVINLGLADKLESLIDKYNLLKNKIDQIEKDGGEVDGDLLVDRNKIKERLSQRIDFTTQKMEDGLVSLGDPKDRTINYYKLLSSLENAKTTIFTDLDILNYKVKNIEVDNRTTSLTRSKGDIDLEKLNKISIENRLASFLDYNEEKRQSAEFKYLMTETAKGAVLGASFAAAGSWIFEQTGLGDWTSAKLSNASKFLHVNQALDSLHVSQTLKTIAEDAKNISHSAWEGTKNLFSGSNDETITSDASAKILNIPKVEILETKTPDDVVTQETELEIPSKPEVYSDEIKNGGSVWKSTRDIFKNNPENFGYKGDVDDYEAINHWSEVKTANVFHNSGEIKNLVYEGNKVTLIPDGDNFKIEIEEGTGLAPQHLEVVETEIPQAEIADEPIVNHSLEGRSEYIEPIKPNLAASQEEINRFNNLKTEVTKSFQLKNGNFESVGDKLIYKNGDGKVVFDSAGKVVKDIFDASGKSIPKEFVDELKGRTSVERFSLRGGWSKSLSAWNKLSLTDKSVYESFELKPNDLLKKINELFNVKTDQGISVGDKTFLTDSGRQFNKDFDGVKKLVKFLSRK